MKLYKLTNQGMQTHNGFTWKIGRQVHLIQIKDPRMCSSDVIHAYKGISLAFLLNPIHGNIVNPRIFEAEGNICVEDWGKVGCFSFKIVREIEIPEWMVSNKIKQRVQIQFAILCAEVILCKFQNEYPGNNKPEKAIEAAKKYLSADAAYAAAYAAHAAHAAYAAHAANIIDFSALADQAVKIQTIQGG